MMIAIHDDRQGWGKTYAEFCRAANVPHVVFDLLADDWLEAAAKASVVFFKCTMYPDNIRILKERVAFLQEVLKVAAFPNHRIFRYFDSKAIERDMFQASSVRVPKTLVAGTSRDLARVATEFGERVVLKESAGAGSSKTRLVRNTKLRRALLELRMLDHPWYRFWNVTARSLGFTPAWGGQVIVQEFIPGLTFDLRVNTVGRKYVYICKRRVRRNDFRASGSGNIVYDWDDGYLPYMRECLAISQRMGFSNAAYDLLVDGNGAMWIGEVSCFYNAKTLADNPNFFEAAPDGSFNRLPRRHPLKTHLDVVLEGACDL
jgi:hypothetical protein